MNMDYVIVQAGGKGTRMESLTRNKPKALVPVENLPMIFHLFRKYPKKKFIVIGDYKYDVLEKYLSKFADVSYDMVRATNHKGTCAGLREALRHIPDGERFLLIWCDLVLPEDYALPETDANVIGLSKDFPCRWSYVDGRLCEAPSADSGVAGFFIFRDKSWLEGVPAEGEFVRWLQGKDVPFEVQPLYRTHEYGLFSEWDKLPKMRTRPFNRVEVDEDKLYKIPVDAQGRSLAVREQAWYRALKGKSFRNLPQIYAYDPLCMEYIDGKNIYEYTGIPFEKKVGILKQIIGCLKEIHALGGAPVDEESYRIAYLDKTYDRLKKVRYLVPFANDPTVTVNGRVCRNIFYHQEQVERMVIHYLPKEFRLIHGDCTFSNMMLKHDAIPMFIDPRGYFGNTELYGDPAYDWVKVYYSLFSNYDQFNLKRFRLFINEDEKSVAFADRGKEIVVGPKSVRLDIASNHWEALDDYFFEQLAGEVTRPQMMIFLAITWLSLTTYAWEDYDSICGAFYNGLYYLEEALAAGEAGETETAVRKAAPDEKTLSKAPAPPVTKQLTLSPLAHTWLLDLDGTIVKHNGYKIDGQDAFLPGAQAFLQSIPQDDAIVFLTSRTEEHRPLTETFLRKHGVRYDAILFGLPYGERILINDRKLSGLMMTRAIDTERDAPMMVSFDVDETL